MVLGECCILDTLMEFVLREHMTVTLWLTINELESPDRARLALRIVVRAKPASTRCSPLPQLITRINNLILRHCAIFQIEESWPDPYSSRQCLLLARSLRPSFSSPKSPIRGRQSGVELPRPHHRRR